MAQLFKMSFGKWIIAIVILLLIWVIGSYNSLVTTDEGVKTAWAQVETSYQRRFDLIPNLVESVKGLTEQEQEVFLGIAKARENYAGKIEISDKVQAAEGLNSALGRLLAIIENYPELRSSEAFQNLMVQLEGTENRISVERKRYNEVVNDFNASIRRVPKSIIANIFGFTAYTRFESVEGSETAPKVEF